MNVRLPHVFDCFRRILLPDIFMNSKRPGCCLALSIQNIDNPFAPGGHAPDSATPSIEAKTRGDFPESLLRIEFPVTKGDVLFYAAYQAMPSRIHPSPVSMLISSQDVV